jgi:hypothetical protein
MTTSSQALAPHGLSLEATTLHGQPVLLCSATGRLTHDDYMAFIPRAEAALEAQPHGLGRLLFDTTALEGWELRAALDDLGFGLRQRGRIARVAVLSPSRLIELSCKVASLFHVYGAELRCFEERQAALEWLSEPSEAPAE